ncbi:18217_t:CDS:2, partial [Dentiscutata erythropus]
MESYETIGTSFSNYNPEEIMEMERYVFFDNIAEGSIQALPNDTKKKTNNEALIYQDSENPNDNTPESSEFADDNALDKNQIISEKENEDNNNEVLDDDETASIQALQ